MKSEQVIQEYLIDGHDNSGVPYRRYSKNVEYGRKARVIGEIDIVFFYDNYIVLYEIKASEKHRDKARSQLERAIKRCHLLDIDKPIFGIFAYKDKQKNINLEYMVGSEILK